MKIKEWNHLPGVPMLPKEELACILAQVVMEYAGRKDVALTKIEVTPDCLSFELTRFKK